MRKPRNEFLSDLEWPTHRWMFEPDGSLRDVYVHHTNEADWLRLIHFVNISYRVEFWHPAHLAPLPQIDADYALAQLRNRNADFEVCRASIDLGQITLNCHFFLLDEIELDLDPKEINNAESFATLLAFLADTSQALGKEVTLSPENTAEPPLIWATNHNLRFTSPTEFAASFPVPSVCGRVRGWSILLLDRVRPVQGDSILGRLLRAIVIRLSGASATHAAWKSRR